MSNFLRPTRGSSRARSQLVESSRAGLTLAASVGLFAYGGLWLDQRFGTAPLCLLVLVGLGFVGGMLHLIRVLAPELWPFGKLPKNGGPPPRP